MLDQHLRRALIAVTAMIAAGCGRAERGPEARAPAPLALSVRALADTGTLPRLEVRPPREVRAWIARVSPAPAGALPIPLPEPRPDTLIPVERVPPPLAVDPGLMPPVLITPATLILPAGAPRGAWSGSGSVDLDVRVSETGEVSEVRPASGEYDSALVAAARDCALRMRFYPALRGGEPVAVWCRQRFDFGPKHP